MRREVLYGATPAEQARNIVEAQVAAAPTGYTSAIAPGTKVRAVFLAGARRRVRRSQFRGERPRTPAGRSTRRWRSSPSSMRSRRISPTSTTVQILVDGKEVDTLAGHVDLRQPLGQAQKWVRKDNKTWLDSTDGRRTWSGLYD